MNIEYLKSALEKRHKKCGLVYELNAPASDGIIDDIEKNFQMELPVHVKISY